MKVCAVTAALACAGGGFLVDHPGSAGASSSPAVAPVTLDHYLCTGDSNHGGCAPTTEALPNGTTFAINNAGDNLQCTPGRGRRDQAPATVSVTNEFSSTPVPLTGGRLLWTCSLLPAVQLGNTHAQAVAVPLATFTCSATHYPTRNSARFAPPFPVTVGNDSVRVLDPGVLCVPATTTAGAVTMDLVCFPARVVNTRRRFFAPVFGLCVPSSQGGDPPASSSTSTSSTTSSSTTSSSTTAASTTTTVKATTTTSTTTKATTTTASTTTTTMKPTTTTASSTTTSTTAHPPTTPAPTSSTTTTTTNTTGTQPCAGVLIGGVCIINV